MPKMKTRRAGGKTLYRNRAPASLREKAFKSHILEKNLQREREILEKQHWFPNLITNA